MSDEKEKGSPPEKIITTKDEKIGFLRLQKEIMAHQQDAMMSIQMGQQAQAKLSTAIANSRTEHSVDTERYILHPDELDWWDKTLFPSEALERINANVTVQSGANGLGTGSSPSKP